MLQELFRIPGLDMPIYGYGLMMVIGFLGAVQLSRFLARRSGIDPDVMSNCGIIALVAGIVGARLSHVLENFGTYTDPGRSAWDNFYAAINIRSGGLTFYGGFILATFCCIAYGMYRKVPVKRGMDIVAPCLMIGLGFGRIGCFLNGCCEGAECNLPAPIAVEFPYATNPYERHFDRGTLPAELLPPAGAVAGRPGSERPMTKAEIAQTYANEPEVRSSLLAQVQGLHSNPVFNAQLASTVTAFLLAVILVAFYSLPHAAGRVFALLLMLESPMRFLLEMMRAEPAVVGPSSFGHRLAFLPDMSFSMVVSLGLFILGVAMWFFFSGKPDDMKAVE